MIIKKILAILPFDSFQVWTWIRDKKGRTSIFALNEPF